MILKRVSATLIALGLLVIGFTLPVWGHSKSAKNEGANCQETKRAPRTQKGAKYKNSKNKKAEADSASDPKLEYLER